MLTLSETARLSLLRGNQQRFVRVESWYDQTLLDDDIPVSAGSEEVDRGSNVPERITLTVPVRANGVDYTPDSVFSPLAANGQMLRMSVGIGVGLGLVEWLQRGWYVITDSERKGDVVEVQAAGLLWKIQEARLAAPLQADTSFTTTIRSLVEPALTVVFDTALADRAVVGTVNFDGDRLEALTSTLNSWPATADVTSDGYLYVTTADDAAAVSLALSSGPGGIVISRTGASTRDGVYNAVVVQGTKADGGLVRGVVYDFDGPKRSGGPFNELPVPLYFDSPLITTQAQANQAAASRLKTLKRKTSATFDVEMVPHPALQAGDRVTLDGMACIVEKLRLPLTASGGSMNLTARKVS